ncbi:hypothetical protein VTI28DRAFT_7194 [Corynascus sepedonium]
MATPSTPGPFTEFPGKGLPDINRYITTNNGQGESVFLPTDNGDHQAVIANGHAVQSILYTTQGASVDLNGDPGLHVPGGTLVRMLDFAPGAESPMHRTLSVDYGTVIQGEFEVELDSGEKRTMRSGDVLVQRATAHKWRNLSPDKPGRMLFVLLDCKPLDPINGKEIKVDFNELQADFPDAH